MTRSAGQFLFSMLLECPREARHPNDLLHKQILQREMYAALRGYLRRTIIPSEIGGLMLITPDKFHIHQWHTLSMEDTSPPQQLSNLIMENHNILGRISTTISAAKTSTSSTKRARGPITLSLRNVSNPDAAKMGMDSEMRRLMEEEARKIKAIKEQRELRERDRARAEEEQNRRDQEAYNAAIPKSRHPWRIKKSPTIVEHPRTILVVAM